MMWPHEWYGTMFLGPLMMLPFIAAIGVLVFLGVRWVDGSGRTVRRAPQSRALEILASPVARSTRRNSRGAVVYSE
jgi:hypothetical protein